MGPQIAWQTLATKRNVTNRNRMVFCQQKMRHRLRCRRRPLEQSFRTAIKLQAATSTLQRNINHPGPKKRPKRRLFWIFEVGVWNFPGCWGLGFGACLKLILDVAFAAEGSSLFFTHHFLH
jgi:hypothetical protein